MVWPFQVTLFKLSYFHVQSEQYFKKYKTVSRGNPNYFITYGNGKSAARVQRGLRPNGAHRWYNYNKTPRCVVHALVSNVVFPVFWHRICTSKLQTWRCIEIQE